MSFSDEEADRDESLYAYDERGQLILVSKTNQEKFRERVTLRIDGKAVTLRKASFATDHQGHIRRDSSGTPVLRPTTIYDAANRLRSRARQAEENRSIPSLINPIPVLCYQEHLSPVGLCRVCSVLVGEARGKQKPSFQFLPACCTEVRAGMDVHTIASNQSVKLPGSETEVVAGFHVRERVAVLFELLVAHHVHSVQPQEGRYRNEIRKIVADHGLHVRPERFAKWPDGRTRGDVDRSAGVILVDHNNCILCSRCVRSCTEVRPFRVIGLAGKGSATRISFDLDQPMGASGCVKCGECTVSCPTGALSFLEPVHRDRPENTVPAEQVARHPLFRGIPENFLKWNEGAVIRRAYRNGEVLCREGEYGPSAFVILEGEYEIWQQLPQAAVTGLRNRLRQVLRGGAKTVSPGVLTQRRSKKDILLGEMSLLSNDRRTATIKAASDDCVVWEVRGNLIRLLQRNRFARRLLTRRYTRRALQNLVRNCRQPSRAGAAGDSGRWLFTDLTVDQSDRCVQFLRNRMTLLQVGPGQVILQQGNDVFPAPDAAPTGAPSARSRAADGFYILRSGFVRVSECAPSGEEVVLDYLRPGDHFGEIGLLAIVSERVAAKVPSERAVRGQRTTTCTALSHVELVRVPGKDFLRLLSKYPDVLDQFVDSAEKLLDKNARTRHARVNVTAPPLDDFVRLGLYQGQNLLLIDLDRCTRCDECTRACVESHADGRQYGVTRLERRGPLFEQFLVVTSCRSCHQPYCLNECPVDAIHRKGTSLEIVIENHCIGCGLCAHNCPYDNIKMHTVASAGPEGSQVAQVRKATTCDLCGGEDGPGPRCVAACPHHAAFRCTGPELLQRVSQRW
jgi:CRP-like cAMP-binding protein/Fe-S-cluster-containing hydrogenase component 2